MVSTGIRGESQLLLMAAELEPDNVRAQVLRYRSRVLLAQADHLDKTGNYIELPSHIGASVRRGGRL